MAPPFCSHAGSPGGASGCRGDSRPCDRRREANQTPLFGAAVVAAFRFRRLKGGLVAISAPFVNLRRNLGFKKPLRRHPFYWLFLGSLLWSRFQIKRRRKPSVCCESAALSSAQGCRPLNAALLRSTVTADPLPARPPRLSFTARPSASLWKSEQGNAFLKEISIPISRVAALSSHLSQYLSRRVAVPRRPQHSCSRTPVAAKQDASQRTCPGLCSLLPAGRGRAWPGPPEGGQRPAPPTGRRLTPCPAPLLSAMADRLTQLQDAVNSVRRPLSFSPAITREGSWPGLVLFLPFPCGLSHFPPKPSPGAIQDAIPAKGPRRCS